MCGGAGVLRCSRPLTTKLKLIILYAEKERMGMTEKDEQKRPRGRPPVYPMPEPIPDTPENIAKAILSTPPKKDSEWEYLKKYPRST